jgi:hypothetical protein
MFESNAIIIYAICTTGVGWKSDRQLFFTVKGTPHLQRFYSVTEELEHILKKQALKVCVNWNELTKNTTK